MGIIGFSLSYDSLHVITALSSTLCCHDKILAIVFAHTIVAQDLFDITYSISLYLICDGQTSMCLDYINNHIHSKGEN